MRSNGNAITLFARPLQFCERRRARNRRVPDIIPRAKQGIPPFPTAVIFLPPTLASSGAFRSPGWRQGGLRYGSVNGNKKRKKVAKASVYLLVSMLPANMLFHRKMPAISAAFHDRNLIPVLKFNASKSLAELNSRYAGTFFFSPDSPTVIQSVNICTYPRYHRLTCNINKIAISLSFSSLSSQKDIQLKKIFAGDNYEEITFPIHF